MPPHGGRHHRPAASAAAVAAGSGAASSSSGGIGGAQQQKQQQASYRTLSAPTASVLEVKKSRFLVFASPAADAAGAMRALEENFDHQVSAESAGHAASAAPTGSTQ